MTDPDDPLDPPKPSARDRLHSATRAAIGLLPVPLVAGVGAEVFAQVVTPPLDKRRQEWMEEVGQRILRLEAELGVNLDELQQQDAFLDTAMLATQVALRASGKERREALRNAILNAALPSAPSAVEQHIFLRLVDSFTDWHVLVLKLLHDPGDWFRSRGLSLEGLSVGGLATAIMKGIPEIAGHPRILEQIWRDLEANGLHRAGSLTSTMTSADMMQLRTTEFASRFLAFISDPLEEQK